MITKLEIKRQLFHAIMGIILVLLIKYELIDLLGIAILIAVGFLVALISKKMRIPVINWFLGEFEREKNIKGIPGKGALAYMAGAFITYGLFITQPNGKNIILASLTILALGDAAPLFVRHMAKIKHPFNNEKFIEGALLGAMLGFLGAVIFVSPLQALIGSFAAMFVEGIDIKLGLAEVDDNITIPVTAAVIIWAIGLF